MFNLSIFWILIVLYRIEASRPCSNLQLFNNTYNPKSANDYKNFIANENQSISILATDSSIGFINHSKKVVCYTAEWSFYRPVNPFKLENLESKLCTHVIYANVGLKNDRIILPADAGDHRGALKQFKQFKKMNPAVKLLIGIGGWSQDHVFSKNFTLISSKSKTRRIFINSILEALAKYSFDGIELYWQWPGEVSNKTIDRMNYAKLIQDLKLSFGKQYFLAAAVSANRWITLESYDFLAVSTYIDQIHVAATDFYGSWENSIMHQSPLFYDTGNSMEWATTYWLGSKIPSSKIVVVMPARGYCWMLVSSDETDIRSRARGGCTNNKIYSLPGTLAYLEVICYSMNFQYLILFYRFVKTRIGKLCEIQKP